MKGLKMLKIKPKKVRWTSRSETDGAGQRLHRAKAWGGKPDPREERRAWRANERKEFL